MKHYIDKPIIFIGTGRSGTTIISEIIMRHPELAYPAQYNDRFYKYPVISIIRLLFINKIYQIYGQKPQLNKSKRFSIYSYRPSECYGMWNYITGKDIDFSRDFLLNEKISQKQKDFIRNYFVKLMKYQGKRRLAFKITGPSRIHFLQQILPDAYFVYLKRNPVPVISSFLKVKFWETRGNSKLHWLGAYTNKEINEIEKMNNDPVYMTAIQIKKLIDMHYIEVERCQPKIIEVAYEDFVKNPEVTVNRILHFTNLEQNAQKCFKYLQNIQIVNRNKKDNEYFSNKELNTINRIFGE